MDNEISILKMLNYPIIQKMHGIFDKKSIIVTKLFNTSLETVIYDHLPLNTTQKFIIILGIALGIRYLHSMKIAHHDISPNNILLDSHFYPTINDFILA